MAFGSCEFRSEAVVDAGSEAERSSLIACDVESVRVSSDIWRRSSIVLSEFVNRSIPGSGVIWVARRSMSPPAIASAVRRSPLRVRPEGRSVLERPERAMVTP